jgi:hypothetical protein
MKPSANPHLEFLLSNSAICLWGDAELDIWVTDLTPTIDLESVEIVLHCANHNNKYATDTPLREFCGNEKYHHLLPSVLDMVAGKEEGFEGSLTEWVMQLADNYLQGWEYTSLRRTNCTPQPAEHSMTLENILSRCGRGWDELKEDADEDTVNNYLKDCCIVRRTQKDIDYDILLMEEEISSDTFDGSTIDAWQEKYESLQLEVPVSTMGQLMQKLWFPLDEQVSKPLVEYQILRLDGNFAMWACRSETHLYLICFATS